MSDRRPILIEFSFFFVVVQCRASSSSSSWCDLCAIVILSEVVNNNFVAFGEWQTPSRAIVFRCNCNWASELATWRSNCLCSTWPYVNYGERMNKSVRSVRTVQVHFPSSKQQQQASTWIWSRPLKTGFISTYFWLNFFFWTCSNEKWKKNIWILSRTPVDIVISFHFIHSSLIAIGFIWFFFLRINRSRYATAARLT